MPAGCSYQFSSARNLPGLHCRQRHILFRLPQLPGFRSGQPSQYGTSPLPRPFRMNSDRYCQAGIPPAPESLPHGSFQGEASSLPDSYKMHPRRPYTVLHSLLPGHFSLCPVPELRLLTPRFGPLLPEDYPSCNSPGKSSPETEYYPKKRLPARHCPSSHGLPYTT